MLEFLGESLDSKVAMPLGHFLIGSEGDAEDLKRVIDSALTTLRKCDGCLQEIDNETSSDQENVCSTLCNTCFEKKELC